MPKPLPSIDYLHKVFTCNPETGDIMRTPSEPHEINAVTYSDRVRLCRSRNSRIDGKPAGTLNKSGYIEIKLNGKMLKAHRVAWAMCMGKWPDGEVDHINGVKSDNRISNLRDVTRSENQRNRPIQGNNTSGVVGVSSFKLTGGWVAFIADGRKYFPPGPDGFDSAVRWRKAKEIELGFHENHGRGM